MAKKRSTFEVETFKKSINDMILHSKDDNVEGRTALMIALENVLHATGNYRGYGYLDATDMEDSKNGTTASVGINRDETDYEKKFKNTDRTRVRYN